MQEYHSVSVHHSNRFLNPQRRHHEMLCLMIFTVALLALFAVALTQSQPVEPEKKIEPIEAEENAYLQLELRNKRGLTPTQSQSVESEKKIEPVEVEENADLQLQLRDKRGLLYSAAYTAPVAYTAYSTPYAYAPSYAYPYAYSYRAYPYVYSSSYIL
ncbi:uncharacterized protein V1477_019619 [Vespula maculifrons]|uniref:Uncharacterized protein n=1 Tax=Vespula maculifrons TaxID=7453 RepID=A0ABD2AQX2_VESMC